MNPRRPAGLGLRQLGEILVAILGGNILFLLLEPRLPDALRHETFRVDWGLGMDLAICAALYGLVRRSLRR